ncbi:MAG: methyltransferase domain-containing protein [Candidatus Omnitrophota bacterium]
MNITDIEYITLRIARKYFFSPRILSSWARWIPYYRSPCGQDNPGAIVERYLGLLRKEGLGITGKTLLEIGIGRTNATAYGLIAAGAKICYGYEPYARLDQALDQKSGAEFSSNSTLRQHVVRISSLTEVESGSIDLILSHSVLEHVEQRVQLFSELKRIIKNGGEMIHIVDYRDHFFKYPFHFYKFSQAAWQRINPGLTRLRVNDHLRLLGECGFRVEVIERKLAIEAWRQFKDRNTPSVEFSGYSDEDLATEEAVISAKKID